MTRQQTDAELRRAVIDRLESLERAGVSSLPKPHKRGGGAAMAGEAMSSVQQGSVRPAAGTIESRATDIPDAAPSSPLPAPLFNALAGQAVVPAAERPNLLNIIRTEVIGCTRCSELAAGRTQTVFGVGNINTRLMFVGEAPGADEDRQGEPFVGRAGQLLTRIIEACKLRREDVYIANVLKCRPPDNRTPLPDEVLNCRGYLERQIAIIRPEFICCLGAVAAQTILNSTISIGRLRGKFHDYLQIPVVCTYHPSYLLRNPDAKRFVWDDMKMLMKRMGVEL